MESKLKTTITKHPENKLIKVIREFAAPTEQVWRAWTTSELLDLWWAPRPYKTETKSMDFIEGGLWLYAMVGPDGSRSWVRVDFESIEAPKRFTATDVFCDELGNPTNEYPGMHWNCLFEETENGTVVTIDVTFESEADLHKIVELGFSEGFTMAHSNLDELLEQHK